MVLYIENPKEHVQTHKHTYTHELLKLINEFSKVAEFKINKWHCIIFLYTSNEQPKIKKAMTFIIMLKSINYFIITLIREVQVYTQKEENNIDVGRRR